MCFANAEIWVKSLIAKFRLFHKCCVNLCFNFRIRIFEVYFGLEIRQINLKLKSLNKSASIFKSQNFSLICFFNESQQNFFADCEISL